MSTFDGNANDAPAWSPVPLYGVDCVALGGWSSDFNQPIHAIVQRLNWLKQNAGSRIFSGVSVPDAAVGNIGDYYIDSASALLYGPKADNATPWTSPGSPISLRGTSGTSFLNGTTAPDADLGQDGDFYLNTATLDLYGPKNGGWGTPTSLKGPTGPVGQMGGFTHRAVFSTAGQTNWPIPAGVERLHIEAWGPGEGGRGNAANVGGASGGYASIMLDVAATDIVQVTVGAPGQGGYKTAGSSVNGTSGTDTQVVIAGKLNMFARAGNSNNGGQAQGGDFNIRGQGSQFSSDSTYQANGSPAPRGGSGGIGNRNLAGEAGATPGGGGGSGGAGYAGGDGGVGTVIIWY